MLPRQTFDTALHAPAMPESWDPVCTAVGADTATVMCCTKCHSFSFHLVRADSTHPQRAVCAGCLEINVPN